LVRPIGSAAGGKRRRRDGQPSSRCSAARRRSDWPGRCGKAFLLEVRDLWPDALVVKKAIAPWQAARCTPWRGSLYFGADRVVVLTPGHKTELLKKGSRFRGWTSCRTATTRRIFASRQAPAKPCGRTGWDGQFAAVYAGSLTEVTAVETIVRAGAFLRSRPDIRIDLFGYGQSKPRAQALARELGLATSISTMPCPRPAFRPSWRRRMRGS
jgi:hypothetical protein